MKKILDLLSPTERRRGYLLLAMITVMALLEVVGVASIMPFMSVLADPEVVETNAHLNAVYTALGFEEPRTFLFFLGWVVFAALVLSIGFKALTTYALVPYSKMREYTIGKRLVALAGLGDIRDVKVAALEAPHGIGEKARITREFLARKRAEYERMGAEIAALEAEAAAHTERD